MRPGRRARCRSSSATGRSPSVCRPWAASRFAVRGSARRPTTTCSCRCSASTRSRNAAAAIAASEALLGEALDPGYAARGAGGRAMARAARGRRRANRSIVLDGAHNPAGRRRARRSRCVSRSRWDRLHLVISISANKDVAGIAAPLAPLADAVYATRNESERIGRRRTDRRGVRRRGRSRDRSRLDRRRARRRARRGRPRPT